MIVAWARIAFPTATIARCIAPGTHMEMTGLMLRIWQDCHEHYISPVGVAERVTPYQVHSLPVLGVASTAIGGAHDAYDREHTQP
jgi:hypothetical protein